MTRISNIPNQHITHSVKVFDQPLKDKSSKRYSNHNFNSDHYTDNSAFTLINAQDPRQKPACNMNAYNEKNKRTTKLFYKHNIIHAANKSGYCDRVKEQKADIKNKHTRKSLDHSQTPAGSGEMIYSGITDSIRDLPWNLVLTRSSIRLRKKEINKRNKLKNTMREGTSNKIPYQTLVCDNKLDNSMQQNKQHNDQNSKIHRSSSNNQAMNNKNDRGNDECQKQESVATPVRNWANITQLNQFSHESWELSTNTENEDGQTNEPNAWPTLRDCQPTILQENPKENALKISYKPINSNSKYDKGKPYQTNIHTVFEASNHQKVSQLSEVLVQKIDKIIKSIPARSPTDSRAQKPAQKNHKAPRSTSFQSHHAMLNLAKNGSLKEKPFNHQDTTASVIETYDDAEVEIIVQEESNRWNETVLILGMETRDSKPFDRSKTNEEPRSPWDISPARKIFPDYDEKWRRITEEHQKQIAEKQRLIAEKTQVTGTRLNCNSPAFVPKYYKSHLGIASPDVASASTGVHRLNGNSPVFVPKNPARTRSSKSSPNLLTL